MMMTLALLHLMFAPALPPAPAVPHWLSVPEKIVREAGPREAHLALAIAFRESRFERMAVSETRDFGVFQIHYPGTGLALGLRDPFNEDLNIVAGVGLLREGWRRYGSAAGAVCYFAHPSRCEGYRRRL